MTVTEGKRTGLWTTEEPAADEQHRLIITIFHPYGDVPEDVQRRAFLAAQAELRFWGITRGIGEES